MVGRTHLVVAALVAALAGAAAAAGPGMKPLPRSEAVSSHSPYEMGECEICHQRNDVKNPGPVQKAAGQLCADCHDDLSGTKKGHPTRGNCTACHSPHNAKKPKLLF